MLQGGASWAAWLVRLGLIRNLAAHAPRLRRFDERFIRLGSDVGGMVVELAGHGIDGASLRLRWWLDVAAGDGPVVAKGARPCMSLRTLDQLTDGFTGYARHTGLEVLD